ncbi:MAG: chloramphenicol acetyltransferase [Herpetosiphonaceae bacterium]|nr:chloramphenicol acetyltransferase [Herpetosiphonaceae bacterium]
MQRIDLETWPRRKHFELYRGMTYPHFSLCAPVDITRFYAATKAAGVSFSIAMTYLLAWVANQRVEFRYRIHGDQVVEHALVHPATTLLTEGDLFSFCTIPYAATWAEFAPGAAAQIAYTKANPNLEDEPGIDDLLFMTSIPWVAFTNMMHPIDLKPADSVPRIAWGKYTLEAGVWKMPLSVQVHHALMDGIHVGRYFQDVQAALDLPAVLFEGGARA